MIPFWYFLAQVPNLSQKYPKVAFDFCPPIIDVEILRSI